MTSIFTPRASASFFQRARVKVTTSCASAFRSTGAIPSSAGVATNASKRRTVSAARQAVSSMTPRSSRTPLLSVRSRAS